jgi:hypothetical protein
MTSYRANAMLSDAELRQAVFALRIVEERGDRDVLRAMIRDATEHIVTEDPRDGISVNHRLCVCAEAQELAGVLSRWNARAMEERCEQAILAVNGYCRERITWHTLIAYAIDLIGPCIELTGESPFVPFDASSAPPARAAAPRPSIRIVGGAA